MAYDLIVIGGGPAGVSAALRARELGATVALVERNFLGGTGMNDGCVPVRVLARAARYIRDSQQFATYGLEAERPKVNFQALLERAQEVVYELHEKKQLVNHLANMGVEVYENVGDASFVSADRIQFKDGSGINGRKFIICVGGHSRRLQFPGSEYALTYDDVWELEQLPESLIIVGGGAIGCQLASVFNTFGVKVTLLNTSSRILGMEDEAISEAITKAFWQLGIEIVTDAKALRRIEQRDDALELFYGTDEDERSLTAETVITAVGWPGNYEALGLKAAGIAMNGPYIAVDDHLRTTAPNIYAAGDITGHVMLVQTASHEARFAVEHALAGTSAHALNTSIPHGSFTDPEYAGIGLTEEEARKQTEIVVAVVPYADMDRAVIDDREVGFCKLIVDANTHQVIGAHVVGEQAVDVVQIAATAIGAGMSAEQLARIYFAYPTFAAIIGLAARQISVEMGWIPVESYWNGLSRRRIAEWERTAGGTTTGMFRLITEDVLRKEQEFQSV